MVSSNRSLDNIVRFRRKVLNLTVISAAIACCLTFALVFTNIRLIDLNKAELNKMSQQQDQLQMNLQASADVQKALADSKAEIDRLERKLKTEKSLSESLKGKLANALKLVAQSQPRETSEQVPFNTTSENPTPSFGPNSNHQLETVGQDSAPVQKENIIPKEADTLNIQQEDATTTPPAQIEDEGDNSLPPTSAVHKPSSRALNATQEFPSDVSKTPPVPEIESSQQVEEMKKPISNSQETVPAQPSNSKLENSDQKRLNGAVNSKSNSLRAEFLPSNQASVK